MSKTNLVHCETSPDTAPDAPAFLDLLREAVGSWPADEPGNLALGPPVGNVTGLGEALRAYRQQQLEPVELPAIVAAQGLAARGEWHGLLALDTRLADDPRWLMFRAASAAAGHQQLNRLRPLRDARPVQRYLQAVDAGTAHGWHVIVYGIFLAVYSVPLRQGLVHYANQTLAGFVAAASGPLGLPNGAAGPMAAENEESIRSAVNALLRAESPAGIPDAVAR